MSSAGLAGAWSRPRWDTSQLAAKETALVAGAEPSGEDPLLQGVRRGRGAAPQSTRKSLNWVAFLPVQAAQSRGCAG
jgi:hypothetical protein